MHAYADLVNDLRLSFWYPLECCNLFDISLLQFKVGPYSGDVITNSSVYTVLKMCHYHY